MTQRNPIIITGGAQRIGLHAATFLKRAGYDVLITYRTPRNDLHLLNEQGITCLQADFSNNKGIEKFISAIQSRYTTVRAIIHNASDWLMENQQTAPAQVMQSMMQVHVHAPYQMNLALHPLLKASATADIIHMTDYVVETGSKKHIAYAASKAALANLTLSFASAFSPDIKVNSIAPSLLMFNENDDEGYREKALKKSLLGIAPGSQEAVESIHYLLNSAYITGRTIHLDGGRHLVR